MLTKTYIAITVSIGVLFLILMPLNIHVYVNDKLSHFLASGAIFIALTTFMSVRKAVLLSLLLLTGAEAVQFYIPYRTATIGDFLANTGGILSCWFLYSQEWLTSRLKSIKLLLS